MTKIESNGKIDRENNYVDNDVGGCLNAVLVVDRVNIVAVQAVQIENFRILEHSADINALRFDDDIVVFRFGRFDNGASNLRYLVNHCRFRPAADRRRHVHFFSGQRNLFISLSC